MKGLKITRAKPSNAIDIYALLKEWVKEGTLEGNPSDRQLQSYYFHRLLDELASPSHFFYVAKRGRGFLGYVHAVVIPGRWEGDFYAVVPDIFVTRSRRKNGIGRKLLDELKKELQNIRIKRVDFSCPEDQTEYWSKERLAKKVSLTMRVDL